MQAFSLEWNDKSVIKPTTLQWSIETSLHCIHTLAMHKTYWACICFARWKLLKSIDRRASLGSLVADSFLRKRIRNRQVQWTLETPSNTYTPCPWVEPSLLRQKQKKTNNMCAMKPGSYETIWKLLELVMLCNGHVELVLLHWMQYERLVMPYAKQGERLQDGHAGCDWDKTIEITIKWHQNLYCAVLAEGC